ncbi:MAG: histidine phosphatase family protein [Planctomycetaceae bacterium]
MPNVVLIRAGATDFDDEHRIQGSIELPLNERGHAEVDALIRELRDDEIDLILTSPAEPSVSTANGISKGLGGLKVKENKGLANLNQGLWEGLPAEEVRRKYPKLFRQWREAPSSVCAPEGETLDELHRRVRKALEKPLKKKDNVAIVVGEPLATILGCILENRSPELSDCLCGDEDVAQVTRVHIESGEVENMWDRPISEGNGNGHADRSKGKSQ